jgi:hypothetical protein
VDASPGFYALWADGNADEFSVSRLYFATKAGEVYVLPPRMEGEYAEPERLGARRDDVDTGIRQRSDGSADDASVRRGIGDYRR